MTPCNRIVGPIFSLVLAIALSLSLCPKVLAQNQTAGPGIPATPSAATTSQPALPPVPGLRLLPGREAQVSTLGSADPKATHQLEVELTGWGAGIRRIQLADYANAVLGKERYEVQSPLKAIGASGEQLLVYPYAARAVTVNGERFDLQTVRWQLTEPGCYEVTFIDAANKPVLRITRKYSLDAGDLKYELLCQQRLTNLGTLPLRLVWEQNAQGDTPSEAGAPSDMRSIVHGYYDLAYNPTRQFVYTNKTFQTRHEFIDHLQPGSPVEPMWPSNKLTVPSELVFLAQLNRYFAVVTHRPINTTSGNQPQQLDALFVATGIEAIGIKPPSGPDTRVAVMTLTSRPIDLSPGSAVDLDLALYAGPRKSEVFSQPAYDALGFSNLIKYELGCTWFTFQPIARGLLAFLKFIHHWLNDWAVAIIILVLCVRLILHPITKKSQISMMRMSKQMASIQPEMEKLKEKYKDDQTKLNGEIMRLYREKGVNPAGFLGCLPMFLQMPIWVALYAMLYFAIELRHQPAFYGIFQSISGGKWFFLADLSSPDHFIRFSDHPVMVNIPLLSSFDFSALNILPLMMAVVFYAQQKLTQPAPTNDQQKQQQQIMLISTMLFPVFLYNSPSGLTLYIMSSTLGGIIDSWIVRRHIKREEAAGTLLQTKPAKPVKPGSFMDRLSKMVEAKQREMMNNPRDDKRKER